MTDMQPPRVLTHIKSVLKAIYHRPLIHLQVHNSDKSLSKRVCLCMCVHVCACVCVYVYICKLLHSIYLFHGVLHELIEVLVVLNGILILEITAKCEHNVVSSEVASLEENVFDECVHTFIHIVVKQIRIIL